MRTKRTINILFCCVFIIFQFLFAVLGKMMYDNIPEYAESVVYYMTRLTIAEYWLLGIFMLLESLFDIKFLTSNRSETVKTIINSILLVISISLLGFVIVLFLNITLPLAIYIFFAALAGIYLVLRIFYAFYSLFKKKEKKKTGDGPVS